MDFLNVLENVLKKDDRFVAEDGKLLKPVIYSSAMNMDEFLIALLIENQQTKEHFFTDVNGILVFDKVKFGWVVDSKEFLPDSYTSYKNKIGLVDSNGHLLSAKEDVTLVWPYKDCILEGGQTKDDQKRDEIFYNETLAPDEVKRLLHPKVLTGAKRYTKDGAENITAFDDKDNLIIKGNNLLALSSLLARHEGKVKCIYIDPPYYFDETKEFDSFKYNSNFKMSTWLVFMKDRLFLAKKLLIENGTLWISISDDGMHYLKVMADDIFGQEHFVGTVPRRTRNGKSDVPFNLSQDFDWLLCYTNVDEKKSPIGRSVERKYYETPDYPNEPWRLADATSQRTAVERPNSFFTMINPKSGEEYPASDKRTWAVTKETFNDYYQKGAIVFPNDYAFLNIGKPYMRKFKSEDDGSGKLSAVISDFQMQDFLNDVTNNSKNKDGNKEIDVLFGRDEFDYAKPENLIKALLEVTTKEGDIVLDFHLGSGTTAAVAHKMGRQYIGVEQMDYINTVTVPRLEKVIEGEQGGISKDVDWQGGGSFVYCELKELNEAYVKQIQAASSKEDIENIKAEIIGTGFISHKVDIKEIAGKNAAFDDLSLEEQKQFLMELIDKNKLYVNHSEIDDKDMKVSDAEKAFSHSFYKKED